MLFWGVILLLERVLSILSYKTRKYHVYRSKCPTHATLHLPRATSVARVSWQRACTLAPSGAYHTPGF